MFLRCPQFTYVGNGKLKGYKWVISVRGYANVIPSGGEEKEEEEDGDTYGVVYTLTESDMDSLDIYEGTQITPIPAYVKATMDIEMLKYVTEEGMPPRLPCLIYVDPRTALGEVKEEYVERINRGLIDAQLPERWVERVVRKWIPAGVGFGSLEEQSVEKQSEEEESEEEESERGVWERRGGEARSRRETRRKIKHLDWPAMGG